MGLSLKASSFFFFFLVIPLLRIDEVNNTRFEIFVYTVDMLWFDSYTCHATPCSSSCFPMLLFVSFLYSVFYCVNLFARQEKKTCE